MDKHEDKIGIHLHCLSGISPELIRPLLCGIEEEGIPFFITISEQKDICEAGLDAARASRLGVGLGISTDRVTLHHEKVGLQPVFSEQFFRGAGSEALRRIGANGARLIKGIPFLFPGESV
ncbi:glycerol dehydratase reactivase beta/small subunit family protein [Parendozoicomonas haliclonae]|uniref:Dehydratase medium subunit n=1 Tax=Parendozoicomonas haliclonae TaxID=1960125 RepID=A0A1X7APC4_9GAMM|nr:glycerol dehydratase reactivase beta/small subunit family protein [Parendozoicomonas haliclonae]SMA50136.1 Dehydratase medium subunit [Parendozoicomonas haliclonae]